MSNSKATARPASGAPGVKLLITAASLASTIGGWALISNTNNTTASSTPATASASTQPIVARSIEFGPLPTLVPPPDPKSLVIKAQPVQSAQPVTVRVSNQAAAAPAPAPQIAGLRVVNAPAAASGGNVAGAPSSTTTTHSSKP